MLTHLNIGPFTFEPYADRTKVLAEQKNVYELEKQSEMSTTEQKTPVGKLRRKKGVSVLLPPTKASDALRGNISQIEVTLKKIESLENELKEKDILLKERKKQICDLGNRCEDLQEENKKLKERMESKEYRDEIREEVRQECVGEIIGILLEGSERKPQSVRTAIHTATRVLCEKDWVPEDMKERIRELEYEKETPTTSIRIEKVIGSATGEAKIEMGANLKQLSNE